MPKMATEQPQTVSHFVLKLCIPMPHGIFPHATSALFNTPRAFVPVLYWLYIFVVAINLRPLFQSLLCYHHACLVLASFTIYYQPILAGPVDHSAQTHIDTRFLDYSVSVLFWHIILLRYGGAKQLFFMGERCGSCGWSQLELD
jgi:hypothetical protein